MTYLSVNRFWDYQNSDVWKKSKGHPPWFKHYVHRDLELDRLDPMARLLFYELLGAATRHKNVLLSDPKWLLTEVLMDEQEIAKHLPTLLKGGWIKESQRPIRSRKPSRKIREKSLDLIEEEEEEDIPPYPHRVGAVDNSENGSPRSLGTNPRAVASAARRSGSLQAFVTRFWDEYPDPAILVDELCDRGCRRDEAEDLVRQEKAKREEVAGVNLSKATTRG